MPWKSTKVNPACKQKKKERKNWPSLWKLRYTLVKLLSLKIKEFYGQLARILTHLKREKSGSDKLTMMWKFKIFF